ncbi:MAG: hypothetical protein KKH28_07970 [Elusimicrobia bacterium]|nr:hypothetical protein [Elusimicrobiota bacterium]
MRNFNKVCVTIFILTLTACNKDPIQLSHENYAKADKLFQDKKWDESQVYYKLIPQGTTEYAIAAERLGEIDERQKIEKLKNLLIGDWTGAIYMINTIYAWEPIWDIKIRVTDDGKIKYTSSMAASFRETNYVLDTKSTSLTQKDEFGDKTGETELFPFETSISGYKYKYLLYSSSEVVLYESISNATGKGRTGSTKIVLKKSNNY